MDREQYLLAKLAEESSEVSQMALKTQQFGMEEKHPDLVLNNRERLHEELNDLFGIVDMLNKEFNFNFKINDTAVAKKCHKVNQFYRYSVELGKVEDRNGD